jgi:hypothetical protein
MPLSSGDGLIYLNRLQGIVPRRIKTVIQCSQADFRERQSPDWRLFTNAIPENGVPRAPERTREGRLIAYSSGATQGGAQLSL